MSGSQPRRLPGVGRGPRRRCAQGGADGLYDIEARLRGTKAAPFANGHRGEIRPGAPLHGMGLRLTVDEDMLVVACEASSDHTPYAACPQAAPDLAALLAGLRIGPGFNRAVVERVGGVKAAPTCASC